MNNFKSERQRKKVMSELNHGSGINSGSINFAGSDHTNTPRNRMINVSNKRIVEAKDYVQVLEKLSKQLEVASRSESINKLNSAYGKFMGTSDSDKPSMVEKYNDLIFSLRLNEILEVDYHTCERLLDDLREVEAEMGNFWWDNQLDVPALQENLKEQIPIINDIIARHKKILNSKIRLQ